MSAEMGGFEFSPEVGLNTGYIKDSANVSKKYNTGIYGRLWMGMFDIVLAPQLKYDVLFNKNKINNKSYIGNLRYGLALGYNIDLALLRLTPYIEANKSSFSERYDHTMSYNVGLKLKPTLIPLSVSLQYDYQKPKILHTSQKQKLDSLQLLIGIHF